MGENGIMRWYISLKSNKKITFDEAENIINQLPERLLFFGRIPHLNECGWNAITDISKPKGNELILSGSYGISNNKAEDMAKYLKEKLEDRGHNIAIEYCW